MESLKRRVLDETFRNEGYRWKPINGEIGNKWKTGQITFNLSLMEQSVINEAFIAR